VCQEHRPFPDAVAEKSAARERDAPAPDEWQSAAAVRPLNLSEALPLVGSELCTPDADRSAEQSFWEAALAAELAAAPPLLLPGVGREPSVALEAQPSRSADLRAAVTRQEAWLRPAQAHWAGPWARAR
jgi:hypothetical protein